MANRRCSIILLLIKLRPKYEPNVLRLLLDLMAHVSPIRKLNYKIYHMNDDSYLTCDSWWTNTKIA